MSYTKIFDSILRSTVWEEEMATRIVWITLLALRDQRHNVISSMRGLARTARVTVEQAQEAIDKLMAPDPYSGSKECDGRRIVAIEGGWFIVNGAKYRDLERNEARREYKRAWAEDKRKKIGETPDERAYVKAAEVGDLAECDRLTEPKKRKAGHMRKE